MVFEFRGFEFEFVSSRCGGQHTERVAGRAMGVGGWGSGGRQVRRDTVAGRILERTARRHRARSTGGAWSERLEADCQGGRATRSLVPAARTWRD